jgi:hypothetical protein
LDLVELALTSHASLIGRLVEFKREKIKLIFRFGAVPWSTYLGFKDKQIRNAESFAPPGWGSVFGGSDTGTKICSTAMQGFGRLLDA